MMLLPLEPVNKIEHFLVYEIYILKKIYIFYVCVSVIFECKFSSFALQNDKLLKNSIKVFCIFYIKSTYFLWIWEFSLPEKRMNCHK